MKVANTPTAVPIGMDASGDTSVPAPSTRPADRSSEQGARISSSLSMAGRQRLPGDVLNVVAQKADKKTLLNLALTSHGVHAHLSGTLTVRARETVLESCRAAQTPADFSSCCRRILSLRVAAHRLEAMEELLGRLRAPTMPITQLLSSADGIMKGLEAAIDDGAAPGSLGDALTQAFSAVADLGPMLAETNARMLADVKARFASGNPPPPAELEALKSRHVETPNVSYGVSERLIKLDELFEKNAAHRSPQSRAKLLDAELGSRSPEGLMMACARYPRKIRLLERDQVMSALPELCKLLDAALGEQGLAWIADAGMADAEAYPQLLRDRIQMVLDEHDIDLAASPEFGRRWNVLCDRVGDAASQG